MECVLDRSDKAGTCVVRSEDVRFRILVEQGIAAITLLVMIVPIAAVALATRLTLGPPVLFRQVRVGQNMQTFTISKFRTMHNTNDPAGKLLPDRVRETPVSRFMRRIRIDEFPQLFAILCGKMAFIGPRPLLPETVQSMGYLGKLRCRVRPGLTGWAQVNGNTKLTNVQKLALDVWYVDHRSVKLDLCIVVKTVKTLLGGEKINQRQVTKAEQYVEAKYGKPDGTYSDHTP